MKQIITKKNEIIYSLNCIGELIHVERAYVYGKSTI